MSPGSAPLAERLAAIGARAVAVTLPLAALAALRLFEPLAPARGGVGWLIPAAEAASAVVLGAGAVALLVGGLRRRAAGPICWAAALTAIAGGLAAASLGQPIAGIAVLVAGGLLAAGGAATRMGAPDRVAGLRLALLLYGSVGIALIGAMALPGAALDAMRLPLAAVGALGAALGAALAFRRGPWMGAALIAAGATALATARPDSLDLLIAPTALFAGAMTIVGWPGSGPGRDPVAGFVARSPRLPELTAQIADGALLFDGRLRLHDWNAVAAELLAIGPDAHGARLEDVLGTSLGSLQRRAAAELHSPLLAPSGEPLELTLVPLDGWVLVLARDPGAPGGARVQVDRLTRELRATIEELMQARRTIELQRDELERAVTIDPLTGVASRAAILERLRVEVAQARRYAHPVAVVQVDIDGFTAINHEHGLEVGDAVLREVALRMRLRIREADALGRCGGDAFLAILPHTDEAGAATFADALRHRLAQRPAATAAGDVRVTASVGVALVRPGEELDVDGLLARADEALGSARAGGGDRIALDRLHGLARLGRAHETSERDAPAGTQDSGP